MAINFLVSLLKKNWNNVSRLSRKDLKILKDLKDFLPPVLHLIGDPLLLAFCHSLDKTK